MRRLGDLIPDAARALGLEDELRLARAIATFEALVAERVPAAAGACRVVRLEGFAIDVEADAPIVAQELRLRAARAPDGLRGGAGRRRRARDLRVHVRPRRPPRIIPGPASHLGAIVSRSGHGSSRRPTIHYERPAWPPDSN